MSNPINNGGPAFPVLELRHTCGDPIIEASEGMTLRDWFAGQALTGQLSIPDQREWSPGSGTSVEEWKSSMILEDAKHCYKYADAMLKAREVQP